MHPHAQHVEPARQVMLPELLVPLHILVATEDVIDEDVQPTALRLDAGHEILHRSHIQVIDAESDALSAGREHQLAGFLDGLGPIHI